MTMQNNNLSAVFKQFKYKKILVVGDIMLDHSIIGDVERISPEAPVPVVHVKKEVYNPGGAANVASNVASLGAECFLCGFIGDDSSGEILVSELIKRGINAEGILTWDYPTIEKMRIFSSSQHMLRIDYEEKASKLSHDCLIDFFNSRQFDAVIISDYAKGTLNKTIVDALKKLNKPMIVDPKPQNTQLYKGAYIIKPNIMEAEQITGIKASNDKGIEQLGVLLSHELNSNVIITRGKDGVSLFELDKPPINFPTEAKEVFDVTGAGDTFISALTLSIVSGATLKESTLIANYAAGIKVSKRGTATVLLQELEKVFKSGESKLKTLDELKRTVAELKLEGKKIVFTNGCFDLIHVGHTRLLQQAKEQGDVLILGLNTDTSVRRLKGHTRPIISQNERAEILSSLNTVDYLIFFEEDTPLNLITDLKPDVLVKGGDYAKESVVGKDIVEANGGEVVIIPLVEGKSTTKILEKIKKL